MKIPSLTNLDIKSKNVMGVRIPKLVGGQRNDPLTEYLLELPTSINEAIKSFQQVHKMVLDVAEKETALRKLLFEIEKTKRKSNAIENVFIPRLAAAVKFITFRLDEMERDTFIMLKTVKRKMGERGESTKEEEQKILAG
jgi:V/A-type H+-transporting ATPase subunit D